MFDHLEIFYGETSRMRTRVYATTPRPETSGPWRLTGTVQGPFRPGSYTLPATFRFRDLGPGASLLAEAEVIDPCPWSPKTPSIYRVTVEAYEGDQLRGKVQREIGLRTLGAKNQSFYWEGRRWVLRGVSCPSADTEELEALNDQGGVCVMANPPDDFCQAATEQGVPIMAMLEAGAGDFIPSAQRLARHPSVCFLAVQGDFQQLDKPKAAAPNPVWLACVDPQQPTPAPDWADAVLLDATSLPAFAEYAGETHLPIVARRSPPPTVGPISIERQRKACDTLQGDVSTISDFAGFVV
ncbi:hypothetical protein [Lignipirellula cremea]|uniref:Glycoside hydrolase family 2 immunoglobulin-like beta-sandwich domain-containing protein n=1 Tax=Lignipirellula cremea TaxID=2528010 RepID=A0A518DW54_9BACT|nr:hypothetical protein [Lignipirellula cremea]QDU96068.1 hypothetical protein Pla8534_38870 [Lignipirellula cremea]